MASKRDPAPLKNAIKHLELAAEHIHQLLHPVHIMSADQDCRLSTACHRASSAYYLYSHLKYGIDNEQTLKFRNEYPSDVRSQTCTCRSACRHDG